VADKFDDDRLTLHLHEILHSQIGELLQFITAQMQKVELKI